MEVFNMALPRLFTSRSNWTPSLPSLIDRFFDSDLMDWDTFNFAGEKHDITSSKRKRKRQ